MYYEIESCENRLEEETDATIRIQLTERKKTIKEFLHQIEAEVNYDNELAEIMEVKSTAAADRRILKGL